MVYKNMEGEDTTMPGLRRVTSEDTVRHTVLSPECLKGDMRQLFECQQKSDSTEMSYSSI